MAKLETFDNKQTKWEGLWWHGEYNSFSSAAIDLSALKQFKGKVRLYVRKNKFYENGKNGRPNYFFCIKDSKADASRLLEIEDDEDEDEDEDEAERLYTAEEVYRVIHGMESEYGLSYGNNLISDYLY